MQGVGCMIWDLGSIVRLHYLEVLLSEQLRIFPDVGTSFLPISRGHGANKRVKASIKATFWFWLLGESPYNVRSQAELRNLRSEVEFGKGVPFEKQFGQTSLAMKLFGGWTFLLAICKVS